MQFKTAPAPHAAAAVSVPLVMRRVLNYPPMLSWLVFAVPAVLFGADFIRYIACRFKLSRWRETRN